MPTSRVLRTPALLLSLLALPPTVQAAPETPQANVPYVFVTVDSYTIWQLTNIQVTGLLLGESTPRTLTFYLGGSTTIDPSQHLSRCDRMALLAMSKPGAYRFELVKGQTTNDLTCRLTRTAAVPAP